MKPYPPSAPPTTYVPPVSDSRPAPSPSPAIHEHLSSTGFNGWLALIIVVLLLGVGTVLIVAGRRRAH